MKIRLLPRSLLGRVAFSLAAVALLPLAIASFGLVDFNRTALEEQVLRTHVVAAQTVAARVASFLSTQTALARGAAANPVLADPRSHEARRFLAENLGAWADLGVLAVQVVNQNGEEVIRAQLRDPEARQRIAAALVAPSNPAHPANIALPAAIGATVRIAVPLPQGAGLLRLVCDTGRLRSAVIPEALGDQAELLIADRQGKVVLGESASLAAFPREMVGSALSGLLSGAGRFRAPNGGKILGAYAPIPDSDWVVMSRQPSGVAEAVAGRLRRRSAYAIGAALLLVGTLSMLAYGNVIRPIRELAEGQRRLANLPAAPRGGDEIEELRRAFQALERSVADRRSLEGLFLGRYQVIEPLGAGAMGSVFRGWDPKLQRPVALKTVRLGREILPEKRRQLIETLLREAVTLARLSHPHVVPVYDVQDSPEGAFVAMELVDGVTLESLLWSQSRLPVSQAVSLGAAIARALEAAHSQGFIHRDVKPANVLLGRDGSIKVSDFGISELSVTTLERDKLVLGTPGYLPPEALGDWEYGPAGDLFALGVILYRSLCGIHPFSGQSVQDILKATLAGPVLRLSRAVPGLPPELELLVHRLLERDPEARPASAAVVAAELEAIAAAHHFRWRADFTEPASPPDTQGGSLSQWMSTNGAATAPLQRQ